VNEESNLASIENDLKKGRYKFGLYTALPKRRKNKAPRPIAVATVRDRVVQRALLTVLQNDPQIRELLYTPGSFGGLEKRSVRMAIEMVCRGIANGQQFWIRSDIAEFYTKVPRKEVIAKISGVVKDNRISNLLDHASRVELANIDSLESGIADLYPTEEIGVGQGSALSAFLGNVLLSDFDKELNSGNVQCIRWIDDFLILAPNHSEAWKSFRKAKKILDAYSLTPYSPMGGSDKAGRGPTSRSFDFLGCSISPHFVQPSGKSRDNLLTRIDEDIKKCKRVLSNSGAGLSSVERYEHSLISTMMLISQRIRAWANTYSFCNGRQVLEGLDRKIDSLVSGLLSFYVRKRNGMNEDQVRRALGIWLATDAESKPIYPLKDVFDDVEN
jgi:hypothetical protein